MKPLRAYLLGGAASGALIAAALAAFLSVTAAISTRTPIGGGGSRFAAPDKATVNVGPLGRRPQPTLPVAVAFGEPAIPVLDGATFTTSVTGATEGGRQPGGISSADSGRPGSRARAGAGGDQPGATSVSPEPVGADPRPALAKKPAGLPPGLARKVTPEAPASSGADLSPPALAKKPAGLPPGLAKKGKRPPGHGRR